MIYSSTVKICMSKFSLVWKLMVYFFVTYLFTALLAVGFSVPIYRSLSSGGLFKSISTMFELFFTKLNFNQLLLDISTCTTLFFDIIKSNILRLTPFIILLILTIILLNTFIKGFYKTPIERILGYFMSSNSTSKFFDSFLLEFRKNFYYQVLCLFIVVPINVLIFYIMYLLLPLILKGGFYIILIPLLMMVVFTLLNSLKLTIFAGWLPHIIYENENPLKSLLNGFKIIARRFLRVFSSAMMLTLSITVINLLFGIFTFGAGLIITVPLSYLAICVFEMVSYYYSNGLRFYVDPYNVIAPKRRKYTENFGSQKYII